MSIFVSDRVPQPIWKGKVILVTLLTAMSIQGNVNFLATLPLWYMIVCYIYTFNKTLSAVTNLPLSLEFPVFAQQKF